MAQSYQNATKLQNISDERCIFVTNGLAESLICLTFAA